MDSTKHCEEHSGVCERMNAIEKAVAEMKADLKEMRTLLAKAVVIVAVMAASGAAFGDWARSLVVSLLGK